MMVDTLMEEDGHPEEEDHLPFILTPDGHFPTGGKVRDLIPLLQQALSRYGEEVEYEAIIDNDTWDDYPYPTLRIKE